MTAGLGLAYADLTDGLDGEALERIERLIADGPGEIEAEDKAANSAAALEMALAGGDVRWPEGIEGVAGGDR